MARQSAPDKDENAPVDFETILSRLQRIVNDLESGERGLEESLALFEQGVALSRQGHAILDKAESRVQTLLESGEVTEGVEDES
jgi:exodeoxyribonuclease VII small subunit